MAMCILWYPPLIYPESHHLYFGHLTYSSIVYPFPDTLLPASPSSVPRLYKILHAPHTVSKSPSLQSGSADQALLPDESFLLHQNDGLPLRSAPTILSSGQNNSQSDPDSTDLDERNNRQIHHVHFSEQGYTMYRQYLYRDAVQKLWCPSHSQTISFPCRLLPAPTCPK